MFKNWTWKKWLCAGIGGAITGAGFVFPVVAPVTMYLGPFVVGLAIKAPGDLSGAEVRNQVNDVANKVVPAVVAAALANQGKSAGQVAAAARDAAAGALAK